MFSALIAQPWVINKGFAVTARHRTTGKKDPDSQADVTK